MMMRGTMVVMMIALGVAGCGEKAQTATVKKADTKAWESASSPYADANWKGGDQAAWEAQMRTRAQGQDEYSRSAAAAPSPSAARPPTKTP